MTCPFTGTGGSNPLASAKLIRKDQPAVPFVRKSKHN